MSFLDRIFKKNQDVIYYDPQTTDNEEFKKKLNYVEKILALEFLFQVIIGIAVIVALIAIFVWNYPVFRPMSTDIDPIPPIQASTQRVVETKPDPDPKQSSSSATYINEQTIDLETTFRAPADKIKLTVTSKAKKEIVGFLPYWSLPKIDEINTDLLTAISFFGLEVDGDGNLIKSDSSGGIIDAWYTFKFNPKFDRFLVRVRQKKIKIYLTLKCFNQTNIVKLVTSEAARRNFINTALYLMNSNKIDGINLDFEYLGTPPQEAIDGFSALVIDLNKEMKNQYSKSVLSIDTFVDAAANTRLSDVGVLAQNSDALMVMGYDFHTPKSSQAGPVAPLEGSEYSLFGFMGKFLDKVPPEKLILIVPYYGYDWPVGTVGKNAQTVGSKTDVKILSYAVVMDAARKSKVNWDDNSQTPWYSYYDSILKTNRIVHFDNVRSLGIKYDYVLNKHLQGVGIWALGFDGKRNDLIQLLNDKFTK